MSRIGIIGAGAWGMALASVAERAGHEVTVWARRPEIADEINTKHALWARLHGISFGKAVRATTAPRELAPCDGVLAVVPAQYLRAVLAQFSGLDVPVILCAKGIEAESGLLMNEVLTQCLPACPPRSARWPDPQASGYAIRVARRSPSGPPHRRPARTCRDRRQHCTRCPRRSD